MAAYRLLLLLYPATFRAEYGSELSAIFARRLRDAGSAPARTLIWLGAIVDVLFNSVGVHLDILFQDVRYTTRALLRSPGFAITAIAVAALGVGATTAAYTITDHVLIKALPYPDPDRLVDLWEDMSPGSYREMEPSPANYRDWKQMSRSFNAMAASRGILLNMVGAGQPEQIQGASVTSDLFPMLGARATLGRLFTPEDDRAGAGGTVVLSYGMWQRRFAGAEDVFGRKLLLDDQPFTVIGVMRPNFAYPARNMQLWTAMRFSNNDFEDRNNNYLHVLARLAPGVSIDQARSEMQIISQQLKRFYPKDNEHVGVTILALRDEISRGSRMMLFALLGAALCVLLIACTNLANLLLARALVRRKEMAVRQALGAGRERLVRQMLTESLMLALLGGLLGIPIAGGALPLLARLVPNSLPAAELPTVDARVLLFALALTIANGICFGVVPAARAASHAQVDDLQEGSRQGVGGRRERLRSVLVIAEVALSLVLLISSGLLLRALWKLEQTSPGFQPEGVLTLRTSLPMPKYEQTQRRIQFYTRVLSEIRRLPGVTSAGYTSFLPLVQPGGIWPVTLEGEPKNADRAFKHASLRYITPGFLETMKVPLLRGRAIGESDTDQTQYVAVVSESFGRQFWPGQDPIGHHFDFGFATRTVVGVVGNVRVRGPERSSEPQVYLPYKQVPDNSIIWYAPKDLAVRSTLGAEALMPLLRRIVAEADPEQPIADARTLTEIVDNQTVLRRVQLRVLGGFASIAMVLAGIGMYGLLSFGVSTRSQEIGVRVALGAQPGDVLGMVLREGVALALVGTVVGAVLAYGAGRLLESLLAGVQPFDPMTYGASVAVVVGMTLAGSFWPALKAVRLDPITAIRAE